MTYRLPLLALIGLLIVQVAQAQFRYHYRQASSPYVPLTGGISANGTTIWDDEDYSITMPFSWKLDSTTVMTKLEFFQSGIFNPTIVNQTADISNQTGFLLCDADLVDRGSLAGTGSRSPIRYQTTGTAPRRIFKFELANAGFLAEADIYSTLNDSVNMQLWIYETTNVVEIRFGQSKVSNPSDYFEFSSGTGPGIAHFKNVDFQNGSSGAIYYVTDGSASTTVIDTLLFPPTSLPSGLSTWPADGTVFRFIPKSIACPVVTPAFTNTTAALTTTFTYTGTTTGLDSLVWDFGDGRKQTVTTGFTTALPHTYAAAGKYNVSVIAYTICDNARLMKPGVAVSVGSFQSAGTSVYPNPATNVLHIDGMAAGTRATIYSALGQQVMTITLSGNRESLDLNTLPAGTYMLQLSNGDSNITQRFIKK